MEIKSFNSTTDYMGARQDLDIYIYKDCIKYHLEISPQFSNDIIRNYKQTIENFLKNGILDEVQYCIEPSVLKELKKFINNNFSNQH